LSRAAIIVTISVNLIESMIPNRSFLLMLDLPPISRQFAEPKEPSRVSVILDLDNTLLSAVLRPPATYDFEIDVIDRDQPAVVYVTLRPFLEQFLTELRQFADLYLFTAGTAGYVRRILAHLDPFGTLFRGVFTREDCTQLGRDKFAKDYEKCGTHMEHTFIVDDNPAYFGKWAKNGLAIIPFVGQSSDLELLRILCTIRARSTVSEQ
jgi:Dullard-like phosphatase family protein